MDNAAKQALIKIGTDAYKKGMDDTYKTIFMAIDEITGRAEGWTPEMYIMFLKEVQSATTVGFDSGIKRATEKYGQR